MGLTCSKWSPSGVVGDPEAAGVSAATSASASASHGKRRPDCIDPFMHDLMKRSIAYSTGAVVYPTQTSNSNTSTNTTRTTHGNRKSGGGGDNDENLSHHHDLPIGQLHLLFKRSKAAGGGGVSVSTSTGTGSNSTPSGSVQKRSLVSFSGTSRSSPPSASSSSSPAATATSSSSSSPVSSPSTLFHYPTRLVVRRRHVRALEEGSSGTHIYAIRFPIDQPLKREMLPPAQEQYPGGRGPTTTMPPVGATSATAAAAVPLSSSGSTSVLVTNHRIVRPKKVDGKSLAAREITVDQLFTREAMTEVPKYRVTEWVTVSAEHHVYVVDTGLSALDCDDLIDITEQACRGQYAAYTYAKQTLGCREFPTLARAARDVVHSVVYSIYERFAAENASRLVLDDREPHMVKYDVTKKERQKLDMHTDKSEFTFLIALSNGCGLDYDGGGTYFECLDATIHVQRGQAIVFPGKLRHCGQRITSGVRFLLVGFLVDKTASAGGKGSAASSSAPGGTMNPDDSLDAALLSHIGNIP